MNESLEQRVAALEKWKEEKTRQQIAYPLDERSFIILNKYFLSQIATLAFDEGVGGSPFRSILVRQDENVNEINVSTSLITFGVNITTNVLNIGNDVINKNQGRFEDDQRVSVYSTGELPAPLTSTFPGGYWVIDGTNGGTQIQLSETMGGAAINITNSGTGQHYIVDVT